jgi:hypothetical protein
MLFVRPRQQRGLFVILGTMPESEIVIAAAKAADVDAIKALLTENDLPVAGVDDHWKTFVTARDGQRLVGCGGSEAYSFAALIRSIAVHPDRRGVLPQAGIPEDRSRRGASATAGLARIPGRLSRERNVYAAGHVGLTTEHRQRTPR